MGEVRGVKSIVVNDHMLVHWLCPALLQHMAKGYALNGQEQRKAYTHNVEVLGRVCVGRKQTL